jgi:hypothetical protein
MADKKIRAHLRHLPSRPYVPNHRFRVLNNLDYPVQPELRQLVLDAAREFNYTPNLLAKSLKKNKSDEAPLRPL